MGSRFGLSDFEQIAIVGVLIAAFISLLYAWYLRGRVLKKDKGTAKMQEVWNAIRIGADSYLSRQLRTILPLIAVLTFVMFFSVFVVPPTDAAIKEFGPNAQLFISVGRAIAFIMGATFSLLVGQLGMRMATASRRGFNEALSIAYYSGTITGMLTDGLGLLGGTTIFIIFGPAAPDVLLGFGFGGTLLALFMRVGGGIYTKAADVGADLVGKVEKDIPEDDPRNAAVIADLVGDNVGDCAGMAADIFESYEVTMVSALLLGLAITPFDYKWIVFPLLARGIGVVSTIVGTYAVSLWPERLTKGDAFKAMDLSYDLSAVISIASFFVVAEFYVHDYRVFFATTAGILLAICFNKITDHFTNPRKRPIDRLAKSSQTGAATEILEGLAIGFEATVWGLLVIAITIVASILFFTG